MHEDSGHITDFAVTKLFPVFVLNEKRKSFSENIIEKLGGDWPG